MSRIIAKDRNGIRREFIIFNDELEQLNGYPSYCIAVRIITERFETEFIRYSQITNQYETVKEAEESLKQYLRNNNNIIRKE